jgi:hypothetical protein
MCRRVSCPKCNKPTFAGCGMHVEQVLGGVPKDQRCKCNETKAADSGAAARRRMIFRPDAPDVFGDEALGSRRGSAPASRARPDLRASSCHRARSSRWRSRAAGGRSCPSGSWATSAKRISSGRASADLIGDVAAQLLGQRLVGVDAGPQGHERDDGLALELVGATDHGGLGHRGVRHQGALDLHRAESRWPATLMHVVDAAHDPEVAVGVPARAVAGEVHAGDLAEVGLLEALVVAPDRAQHRRPRPLDDQEPPPRWGRTTCRACRRCRPRCRAAAWSPSRAWSASRRAAARS